MFFISEFRIRLETDWIQSSRNNRIRIQLSKNLNNKTKVNLLFLIILDKILEVFWIRIRVFRPDPNFRNPGSRYKHSKTGSESDQFDRIRNSDVYINIQTWNRSTETKWHLIFVTVVNENLIIIILDRNKYLLKIAVEGLSQIVTINYIFLLWKVNVLKNVLRN